MRWREGTAMPTPRTELAVARLGERVYVAGGYGGMRAFESYAPAEDSWQTHASLPVAMEHPSLAAVGGVVFLTGGGQADLFAYDPATDSWSTRAAMPADRHAAAAVALDGALYIVGGTGPDALAILRYDPGSDSWSQRGELASERDHLTAVALDGQLYLLGGRSGIGPAYTSVDIYDPSDQSLISAQDMGEGRSGFGAAAVGDFICVAGGEVLEFPFSVRDTAECLDTRAGAWTAVDDLPRPLHGIGAAAFGGRMLVFGGAEQAARATPRAGGVYILEP